MSILNQPYFLDEEAAHSFLESIVWKDGPVCPHCGVIGHAYRIKANPAKRVPKAVHLQDRHGVRASSHPTAQGAASRVSTLRFKEGDQL